MSLENLQEDVAGEPAPAVSRHSVLYSGGVSTRRCNAVAFKFGGSSLLGADRMFHAAGLVRVAAKASLVTGVVSAMKGVTDRLLSAAPALVDGKPAYAPPEPHLLLYLHPALIL